MVMLALLSLAIIRCQGHEIPTPDQLKGPTYPPLSFSGISAGRTIRKEDGKVLLTIIFPKPPAKPTTLKFRELTLNLYEPVAPLPLTIDLVPGQPKTVTIAFPSAAAGLGAIDYVCKHVVAGQEGVEEDYGELPDGEPQVNVEETAAGFAVRLTSDVADRTTEFRVESLLVGGRPLPGAAGKSLTLKPGEAATIPGLLIPKGRDHRPAKYELAYGFRLTPNRVWHKNTRDSAFDEL